MLNSILPCNWEILISPGNMSEVADALAGGLASSMLVEDALAVT